MTYRDTNNFHGYTMSKFFPTNGFKWVNSKDFELE